MPSVQFQRYDDILQRLVAQVAARAGLVSLNSGPIYHLLVGTARALHEANYQLVKLGDLFSIYRVTTIEEARARARDFGPEAPVPYEAQAANGYVVFSRASNTGTTLNIPSGLVVATASGIRFRTLTTGQITSTSPEAITGHGVGRDSSLVAIQAITPGSTGNVDVGAITVMESRPTGITSVYNVATTTQGADTELVENFVARLTTWLAGRYNSTRNALISAALSTTDPVSGRRCTIANSYTDPTTPGIVSLYIDDGTGSIESYENVVGEIVTANLTGPPPGAATGGEEYLYLAQTPVRLSSAFTLTSSTRGALIEGTHFYLNPVTGLLYFTPALVVGEIITASYTVYTGLIAEVNRVINGWTSDPENYPGVAADGVTVSVLAPSVVVISVEALVTLDSRFDRNTVITSIQSAVTTYINNLNIGDDVIVAEIIAAIMGVEGVIDVTVTVPAANVTINDNEVARATISDIDIT